MYAERIYHIILRKVLTIDGTNLWRSGVVAIGHDSDVVDSDGHAQDMLNAETTTHSLEEAN
jgi:hypothetical protein